MLIKRLLVIIFTTTLMSGCAILNTQSQQPVPEDFIVKQNSRSVRASLNALSHVDHVVKFNRGSAEVSSKQVKKVLAWLNETQPRMIAVRGTAGSEKYRQLGVDRGLAVVRNIQHNFPNVEMVVLDYDASLAGGRAVITAVPSELVGRVRSEAPILIISSQAGSAQ